MSGMFSRFFQKKQQKELKGGATNEPLDRHAAGIASTSDSDGSCLVAPEFCTGRSRRSAFSRQQSQISENLSSDPKDKVDRLRRSVSIDGKLSQKSLTLSRNSQGASEAAITRSFRTIRPFQRGRGVRPFCKLLEGIDRTNGKTMVIKSFCKDALSTTHKDMMLHEIDILKECEGLPDVVHLEGILEDEHCYYTVLEYCPGKTLIEVIANGGGRLSERRCVVELVIPILRAVDGLHKLNVVHRNLKPEHIMCSQGGIKILDLFEAVNKTTHNLNSRVGQMEYAAPEVLTKPRVEDIFYQVLVKGMDENELPQYDKSADIWSIGVIIFEALTGIQPFRGENSAAVLKMQGEQCAASSATDIPGLETLPEMLTRYNLSPGAQDFLASIFNMNPEKRPSADQLAKHRWLATLYQQFSKSHLSFHHQSSLLSESSGLLLASAPN